MTLAKKCPINTIKSEDLHFYAFLGIQFKNTKSMYPEVVRILAIFFVN